MRHVEALKAEQVQSRDAVTRDGSIPEVHPLLELQRLLGNRTTSALVAFAGNSSMDTRLLGPGDATFGGRTGEPTVQRLKEADLGIEELESASDLKSQERLKRYWQWKQANYELVGEFQSLCMTLFREKRIDGPLRAELFREFTTFRTAMSADDAIFVPYSDYDPDRFWTHIESFPEDFNLKALRVPLDDVSEVAGEVQAAIRDALGIESSMRRTTPTRSYFQYYKELIAHEIHALKLKGESNIPHTVMNIFLSHLEWLGQNPAMAYPSLEAVVMGPSVSASDMHIAAHEALHVASKRDVIQGALGEWLNEGMTEYLARVVSKAKGWTVPPASYDNATKLFGLIAENLSKTVSDVAAMYVSGLIDVIPRFLEERGYYESICKAESMYASACAGKKLVAELRGRAN